MLRKLEADPSGNIDVPVLTVHAVDDPIAFVELESHFRDVMTHAGRADRLVQVFTADREHSYLSSPAYATVMAVLVDWFERGVKPTPASIAARCPSFEAEVGAGCRFLPDYQPAPLDSRVATRKRQ